MVDIFEHVEKVMAKKQKQKHFQKMDDLLRNAHIINLYLSFI